MNDTRFEDRARAVKAARIARVLERVLAEAPALTVADLLAADERFRQRVAVVAQTHVPSRRSWRMACALVEEALSHRSAS